MKKFSYIFVFFATLFLFNTTFADELKFFTGTWDETLKAAEQSGKYIMLDAYTDWCSWCKVMDKETYTNPQVIEFINKNFIPVKFEMETGFGKRLAMKYRVAAFPTQLFFSPQGKLVYTGIGYQKPEQYLATLQKAINPAEQFSLRGIGPTIDLAFPDFYRSAFEKNGSDKKKFPDEATVNAFLDKQTDLFLEIPWCVLYRFQTNDKYQKFFLDNYERYVDLFGVMQVQEKFYKVISNKVNVAAEKKDEQNFNDIIASLDKYQVKDKEEYKDYYKFLFYEKTDNWAKYGELAEEKIKGGKADANVTNEMCWKIYEKCNDEKTVKKAVTWMRPLVEKNADYPKLDTYAALLYKTKDLKNAKIYAEKAIAEGKKTKQNTKATEKLLADIKKAPKSK